MEQHFALIKNNLVEKVIVADREFLKHIIHQYQYIIEVTDIARPNPGDSYYEKSNTFVPNNIDKNEIPVDLSIPHLCQGTESGFEPFQLSKYSVKYENGFVTIGCKQYSAPGLLDVLHKLLIEKHHTTSSFTALSEGPTHGKFGITWDDATKLYNALSKVKF